MQKKKFRPSSAPALKLCAHFESTDQETNDNRLGTQMHACWESIMCGGEAISGEEMELTHTEACRDIAVSCMTRIREVTNVPYNPKIAKNEQKSVVTSNNLQIITEGTLDILYETDLDFDVVVDGKACLDFYIENHYHKPQLACYALGVMMRRGKKKVLCIEAYMMPNKLRSYWMSYDEASAIVAEIVVRIDRKDELSMQPNWSCKYCSKIMGRCKAINEQLEIVEAAFNPVEAWVKDIESITDPFQMSRALNFSKIMDKISKRISDAAKAMAEKNEDNPNFIPTFCLKKENGRKSISDIDEALTLSGVSSESFIKACSVSLPKLAEQYHKEFGGTLKSAKESVNSRLIPVITLGNPIKKLVQVQNPSE